MKELICGFCEKQFLYHRKKKYCCTWCTQRGSKNVKNPGKPHDLALVEENRRLVLAGQKRCTKCKTISDLSNYRAMKAGIGGKSQWCKPCLVEKDRNDRVSDGGKERRARYRTSEKGRAKKRLQDARRRNRGVKIWTPPPCPDKALTKERLTQVRQSQRDLLQYAFENWDSGSQFIGALCWEIFKTQGCGPWSNPGITDAERYRLRYKYDKKYNANERLRRQINKAVKRDGIGDVIRGAAVRGGKSNTVERTLGYSISEFCRHMERQFTKGMDWNKFKAGEIHIDHIIPQKAFELSDEDEWKACWSLTNLQPLWASDNLKKRARIEKLL